jgi:phosphatidylserine/phosphatidylglycerophosphate/cardiolipin synthase-like enzyme
VTTLLAVTLAGVPAARAVTTATGADQASATTATSTTTSAAAGSAGAGAGTRYQPHEGPTFNNPLGKAPARYRTLNLVQQAIDHARPRSVIRAFSWNIMSRTVVDKLLNAQRRGARVLVIMDSTNVTEIPNPSFRRLRAGLALANDKMHLPASRRSHARLCVNSCRGAGGQAHAKFFLFSHTGIARRVLMEGSMNLTAASAINQWNDVFTFRNDKLYAFAHEIFDQAWADKPINNAYRRADSGTASLLFAPFTGKDFHGDLRLKLLDRVKCFGARHAGDHGRTVIRVAPDVLRNTTGMKAAQQLRTLWEHGCSVRIGYTVLGRDIHRLLSNPGGPRGKVPMRHLVQDFNGDGEFDNYFHLKVITINGVVGDNRSAHIVVNGSANISGFAARSDENIAIIHRTAATLAYQKYIEYWFTHFPKSKPLTTTTTKLVQTGRVDPYAHVDMD